MKSGKQTNLREILLFVVFIMLLILWLFTYTKKIDPIFFGISYPIILAFGCYWGVGITKQWRGNTNMLGKALVLFLMGLLSQLFGQIIFTSYILFFHVEIPYPSLADLGFFGSVIFYIFAVLTIAKFCGLSFSILSAYQKAVGIIIFILITLLFNVLSLSSYIVDLSNPIRVFLDFGYPFFEALSLTITILTYAFSRRLLSGLLRSRILLLLFALTIQYIADINFSYQTIAQTWTNSGYGDLLYMFAYVAMAYALLRFDVNTIHSEKIAQ